MRVTLIICLCFFSLSLCCQTYYVSDVDTMETVVIDYCVMDDGSIENAHVNYDNSTYDNLAAKIKALEDFKSFDFNKAKLVRDSCSSFVFRFLNEKYRYSKLDSMRYSECHKYRKGRFQYHKPNDDVLIKRGKKNQIERDLRTGEILKYQINWISDFEYELIYKKLPSKDLEYLIGQKIYVEIIDIVDSGGYVYRSRTENGRELVSVIYKK